MHVERAASDLADCLLAASGTDLDRFIELYRSVVGSELPLRLIIRAPGAPHVGVYDLIFDEHGKFVGQGIWE